MDRRQQVWPRTEDRKRQELRPAEPWKVTPSGIERDGETIPACDLTQMHNGRYYTIVEYTRRWLGDNEDMAFISAFRRWTAETQGWVDEDVFHATLKVSANMKAHKYVYSVIESITSPLGPDDPHQAFAKRRKRRNHRHVADETKAVLRMYLGPKELEGRY
ncbi:hypothetical protein DSM25558_4681 [Agrobacterium sp. DSM 25558]|uniref:hypothetical protein n=1 Tax=Agrobacterium sp. DSM 25558 TaxID=1907665 RepID=UPI0009724338|nr:hypothetical protein [Agrobacterium sp. DSM 25558]SCX29409.1 hypothetical protein DSM25558_4681 [Agrobacterium sp. DSM 25558]